jgi:hypothetical protein
MAQKDALSMTAGLALLFGVLATILTSLSLSLSLKVYHMLHVNATIKLIF